MNLDIKNIFENNIKSLGFKDDFFSDFESMINIIKESKKHSTKLKSFIKKIENKDSTIDTISEIFFTSHFILKHGDAVEIEKTTHSGKNCDLYIDLRSKGLDEYYIEVKTIHQGQESKKYNLWRNSFLSKIRNIKSGYEISIWKHFDGLSFNFLELELSNILGWAENILLSKDIKVGQKYGYKKNVEYLIGEIDMSYSKNILEFTIDQKREDLRTFVPCNGGSDIYLGGFNRAKNQILSKLGEIDKQGKINKPTQFLSHKKNVLLLVNFDKYLSHQDYIDALNGSGFIERTEGNCDICNIKAGNDTNGISNDTLMRQLNLSTVGILMSPFNFSDIWIQNNSGGSCYLTIDEQKALFQTNFNIQTNDLVKFNPFLFINPSTATDIF